MPTNKQALLIASLMSFFGCSEFDMNESRAVGDSGLFDFPDESDADTEMGDTAEEDVIDRSSWWSLSASLVIAKGQPVSEQSQLTLTLYDAGLSALCAVAVPIDAAVVSVPPDASLSQDDGTRFEGIYAWWDVTVGGVTDPGCDGYDLPLPETLGLGIGEMNPEIQARYDSVDASGVSAGALNGAYTIVDGESLYVFGVAATTETFEFGGARVEAAPIPDGTWVFHPYSTFESPE